MTLRRYNNRHGHPGTDSSTRRSGAAEGSRPVICHVLHSLGIGGAEVLADRLARGLANRFRPMFVCLDELGELGQKRRESGMPIELLKRQPGLDRACARRMAAIWDQAGVDLVVAHQYTPFFYALLARRIAARHTPILFVEHGRFHPDRRSWKRILYNRLMLGRADRVIAVGNAVADALARNEGIPRRRVEVVYNGVDPTRFQADDDVQVDVRRALGVPQTALVIIQVARLDAIKDHPTALAAMRSLSSRLQTGTEDAQLWIVGDGPEGNDIRRQIEHDNLSGCVRLLGMREDVHRLLQAADIFLLSSVSEGIPVTVIEAMAARLPVVATRVGGVPEVVVDEETGVLVPPREPQAMSHALARLCASPALRRRLGAAGQQRVHAVFSEAAMHRRYSDILVGMLPQR